jgi:hypothetical protein
MLLLALAVMTAPQSWTGLTNPSTHDISGSDGAAEIRDCSFRDSRSDGAIWLTSFSDMQIFDGSFRNCVANRKTTLLPHLMRSAAPARSLARTLLLRDAAASHAKAVTARSSSFSVRKG